MGMTPIRPGQLNQYIGRVLRMDPLLSDIALIGEISNLKFHHSGHIYFSLKDDSSRISCFLPDRIARQITCPLEEGMEVIASGYIAVFERGGSYSLNVTDISAGGKGELAVRFEQLKAKLSAEGLFDPAHKKPLPLFPKKVAVVTSPTGAAVRDIVKIITSKNDVTSVLICPVLVQGPAAARDIAAAIDELNADHPDIDVIITGRGGGSAEELWAFNEEVVARSIFRSKIPVISAVGHETDFTISDFVADLRAETPTAAADRAVPDTQQLREQLDRMTGDLKNELQRHVQMAQQRLQALDPAAFADRIRTRIEFEQMNLDRLTENMTRTLQMRLSENAQRIELLRQVIEGASPYAILDRGYAMVTKADGAVIRKIGELSTGQSIKLQMSDGAASAQITGIRGEEEQHEQ